MAVICTVGSKLRYASDMRLFDALHGTDFRAWFVFALLFLSAHGQNEPEVYVAHFERACDVMNILAMLAIQCWRRHVVDFPWEIVTLIGVFAGASCLRYEIKKQWPWIVLRFAAASFLDARVARERSEALARRPFLEAFALQVPAFVGQVAFGLSAQFAIERNDRKSFDRVWALTTAARSGAWEVAQRRPQRRVRGIPREA